VKHIIEDRIADFVDEYASRRDTLTRWQRPIVAYADASDALFEKLKEAVGPEHMMPSDFMEDAATAITYFLPFEESVAKSNMDGRFSSWEWGKAYVETNEMILELNAYIKEVVGELGHNAVLVPTALNFTKDRLTSDWSQRHVAYVAGLGKFGLNNMLITQKGCCGRIGSVVTNIKLEATARKESEACLYKQSGACGLCVGRCVNDALFEGGFDREKCYEMCVINMDRLKEAGHADVCGKCTVGLPCSFKDPVE